MCQRKGLWHMNVSECLSVLDEVEQCIAVSLGLSGFSTDCPHPRKALSAGQTEMVGSATVRLSNTPLYVLWKVYASPENSAKSHQKKMFL